MPIFSNEDIRHNIYDQLRIFRDSIRGVAYGNESNVLQVALDYINSIKSTEIVTDDPLVLLELVLEHSIGADIRIVLMDSVLEEKIALLEGKKALINMSQVPTGDKLN